MISFKRLPHATDTTVVTLIIFHLIVWFRSMGGAGGITGSAAYPHSLFVVPIAVWVMALAVFYGLIYPVATGLQHICNQINLSRLHGFFIFFIAIALIAAWPARAFGGFTPMTTWLTWIGYLTFGFAAFWHNGTSET